RGFWDDRRVGQVRETGVFTELNLVPFTNADLNFGYEWAHVDGHNVANNHRNQFFGSAGYTIPYAKNHRARLGYQFLWLGYDQYATTGFYDTVSNVGVPVVTLNPVTPARAG